MHNPFSPWCGDDDIYRPDTDGDDEEGDEDEDDDQGKDEGDEGEGGCDDKAWATMRRSCMKPSNTSGLQRFSHSDHTIVSTNYPNIPKTIWEHLSQKIKKDIWFPEYAKALLAVKDGLPVNLFTEKF